MKVLFIIILAILALQTLKIIKQLNNKLNIKPTDSVIIVGNGPSLLKRNLGSVIDKFDHVIRFNRFKTNGYEKQVGTKTTIWGIATPLVSKTKLYDNPQIQHLYIVNTKVALPKLLTYQIKPNSTILLNQHNNNCPVLAPTSGLSTIYHILNYVPKVYIIGFDGWKNTKTLHYFNHNIEEKVELTIGSTLHQPRKELQCIKKLEKEGKVIRL